MLVAERTVTGTSRGGVSGIGYGHGNKPVAGLHRVGKDLVDGEIGKAMVGVDPVGEEPAEVLPRRNGLQSSLKRWQRIAAGVACVFSACGIVGSRRRGAQRIIPDQIAQHPQDVRGLGAVVDGRGGAARGAGRCPSPGLGGSSSASACRPASSVPSAWSRWC